MAAVTGQHMVALAHAQERRLAAAAARAELRGRSQREGRTLLATMLWDHDPRLESARIMHLLRGIHRAGTVSATRWMRQAGIRPVTTTKRVGELTVRQRSALIEALVGTHPCAYCAGPIPAWSRATYCKRRCKDLAAEARQVAQL